MKKITAFENAIANKVKDIRAEGINATAFWAYRRSEDAGNDLIVDFKGYKWLIQTTDYHEVGETIGIILNPDDIHIMKKSEYSGLFGDYSSYSAEYDEINDPDFAEEDEEDADDED